MSRYFLLFLFLWSCSPKTIKPVFKQQPQHPITGTQFYQQTMKMQWRERDSLAFEKILSGNFPTFLKKFNKIDVTSIDTATNKTIKASIYVMPDYLSIGTDADWARIPLTPITAQQIADSFDCFLPTKKIVDIVYNAAAVKLEPVPMYIYRDSTVTMWQHNLIIEGQRNKRKGLIAGIKKDVVISDKVSRDAKPNRVAIYGWHRLNGQPIQPLYMGHVNWYADYSHGIRLVYRKIKVNGNWMDYTEVLKDPVLRKLICDEQHCDFYRY